MISLAIKLRILDDLFRENKQQYILPFNSVGSLTEDSSKKELTFREACNKIVHALKFQPQTKPAQNSPDYLIKDAYYIPLTRLLGEKGKKKWETEIDMHRFLLSALALTKAYEDNWSISSRND